MINYFYCKAYPIFFIALKTKLKGDEICIITPHDDIIQTCKKINLKYIRFSLPTNNEIVNKPSLTKSIVQSITNKIGNGVLHFSHRQFDLFCFLLVKKYAENNKVVYYDFELELEKYRLSIKTFRYLDKFIQKRKLKKNYNIDLTFRVNTDVPVFTISDKFFSNNNISIFNNRDSYYKDIIPAVKEHQIEVRPIRNLFLTQKLNNTMVDMSAVENIYSILEKKSVTVKNHPYLEDSDNGFIDKYPTKYPVELLLKNVSNSVIAVLSFGLIQAAYYPSIKSISLGKMIKLKNKSTQKLAIDLLETASEGKIIFPTSLKEFESLL